MIAFAERLRDQFNVQLTKINGVDSDLLVTDGKATTAATNASNALSGLTGKADKSEIAPASLRTALDAGGTTDTSIVQYSQISGLANSGPTDAELISAFETGLDA